MSSYTDLIRGKNTSRQKKNTIYENMKLFPFAILLTALTLLACKSTPPVQQPPNIIYPTYTIIPTSTLEPVSEAPFTATTTSDFSTIPAEPAFLEFYYDEQACGIDTPERFTFVRCYSINQYWFTLGLIAYSGNTINFIAISHPGDAAEFIGEQSRKFVTDVALFAGWNMSDLSGAMEHVMGTSEEEWITYNTIEAKRVYIPESNVVVIGFERIP
jgi:hypothetical protein